MRSRILALAAGVAATAAAAMGQQAPFQLLVTQGQSAVTVQNGGTLTFVSPVGSLQSAQLKATYTGNGQVVINQEPIIFGSTEFRATIAGGGVPVVLMNGDSVTVTLQFAPVNANASTAQVSLPFQETQSSGAVNNGALALTLDGTAPSFTLSYILQADQNVVPIQSGGLIPFPATLVGTTAQAALNLTNTGSGPGTVTNVTISGSAAFRLQGDGQPAASTVDR